MKARYQNAVFLGSLSLIGLHAFVVYLLPGMAPDSLPFLKRSWGFHFWTFYPAFAATSGYAVAIAASVPRLNQAVAVRIATAASFLSGRIQNRRILYSGLCLLSWTVFTIGRQKYGFLGDGYVRASDVGAGRIASEGTGALHILVLLQGWLGNWDASGVSSLRFFSVFWGGPYVVLACMWANSICSRLADKVTCAALMVFTGPIQFFFGYIETYAPLPVFSVAFLLSGVIALRDGKPPLWATLFFAAGAFLHTLLLFLFPALLHLWAACLHRRYSLFRGYRALCFSVVAGGLLVCFAATEHSAFLLPLFPNAEQPYAVLSAWHAWEWINAQVLSAPMGWPLLLLVGLAGSRVLCREVGFLAAGASGMLAGLFAIDPVLGSRDWDVLCLSGVPLMALATYGLYRGGLERQLANYASVCSVVLAALLIIPWVHINHTDRSIARVQTILEGDPGSYYLKHPVDLTLATYFSKAGLNALAIEQLQKGIENHPSDRRIPANLGREYALQGDFKKSASNFLRALELSPGYEYALDKLIWILSQDPESIASMEQHFFTQHPDSSAVEKRIAELWSRLGRQAMEKEDYDTAVRIYRRGSMLGLQRAFFLHGLGVAYFRAGDLENALSSLEESHKLAPENKLIMLHLEQLRGNGNDTGRSRGEPPMRHFPRTGQETARTE